MSELSPTNILKVLESRCRPNSDIEGLAATIAVDLSELAELSQETRPILFADTAGQMMNRSTTVVERKRRGQYFTPPQVAEFMVRLFSKLPEQARLLEPGAGSGVLVAALAEHISATQPGVTSLHVQAFENSPQLAAVLELTLGYTRTYLAERGTRMTYLVHNDDFILAHMDRIRPTLFTPTDLEPLAYDLVISNPPYFKLQKADPRVAILSNIVYGQPNIYALFMALSAELLSEAGQLVFITPRSFCSGQYFRQFRKWLFRRILIERIHAFGSRREAFGRDEVLQENVIIAGRKSPPVSDASVMISSSEGVADLGSASYRITPLREVVDIESPEAMLHIPVARTDSTVRTLVDSWEGRLATYGLEISTGPVVAFRARELLRKTISYEKNRAHVPLLWLQHVDRMEVIWPHERIAKPQWIEAGQESKRLLVPNENYVLLRRFSAKEANGRMIAAPYEKGTLPFELLGIENHVNFIHRPKGKLSREETWGLAAYLNSSLVEKYFRGFSGNTQVSATEIRQLPIPPLPAIRAIGKELCDSDVSPIARLNELVARVLDLPADVIETAKSGGHVTKLEEAKDLLKQVGLPARQRNDIAAYTLLALAGLPESKKWSSVIRRITTIHNIIGFLAEKYGKRYAENTRETIRRQVIHQFEQARLVDRNPDDPTLPTNSPRTHYALSEAFIPVVQGYGTKAGIRELESFQAAQKSLMEIYARSREQLLIPLKDAGGKVYRLSPGKHNRLQVAVVEEFGPRFARRARLLYLGDTSNKMLIWDPKQFERIGIALTEHDKLPDVVLYLPRKRWLYLVEVVTSHGPVSPKRREELERWIQPSQAKPIYVSVFPDFKEFKRHVTEIAWETEVWIREMPDHLIHYNGDKFLGPVGSGPP